ncbi:MAG: retroviral-like aspartic protease family protein [Sphingobium sp.]|nr:retroviral-like aspartic protease family protein [Sphingobium sp.]
MFLPKPRLLRSLALGLAAVTLAGPVAAIPDASLPADKAAASAATADAPSTAPLLNVADTAIDFLRIGADDADRMTLPVEIGQGGPYPFIVDTGSYRSIVATELAQRLSLQTLPPVEIVSMAGRETVAAVHLDRIQFGSQVISDLPVLSIAHEALGSAGLIGLDGLKNKRVTLDFKKRQLAISKSSPIGFSAYDRNTIVVQARTKLGQLILVNSKVDGKKVNIILDTGAETSVGNMALFRNLKLKKLVAPPTKVQITSVTGQSIDAQFAIVRHIQIDSVTLDNVPMVFLDAAPFAELDLSDRPAMLLGMRMLRMFDRVAIDFGNRHVDFQLPQGSQTDNAERLLALR